MKDDSRNWRHAHLQRYLANLPDNRHCERHEDDRQRTDGDVQTDHVRFGAS